MRFKITLIGVLLLIVSVVITLNFFFHQSYESEMATQINRQQLIIAKTVASSVGDTLEHLRTEAVSLAGLLAQRGLDPKGLDEYTRFALSKLDNEINVHVTLYDGDGRRVYSTGDVGVAEQAENSFEQVKDLPSGEVYMEDNTEDQRKLVLVTPIYGKNVLMGAVLVEVNIDDITGKFLTPVQAGERGYAWIMNDRGTLVYHPTKSDMVGKNIFKHDNYCYQCHTSFNAEKEILNSPNVGFSSYIAPYGEDKLIAFSRIEGLGWIVCVSIPYSEVTASISDSMVLQSMLVIAIFASTIAGAFFIVLINKRRIRAEAKATYADKVRDYALELESVVQERTKELRSEKEKLDAVIGSIEAGMAVLDEDGTCVWMNKVLRGWLSDEQLKRGTLDDIWQNAGITGEIRNAVVEDRLIQQVVSLNTEKKKGFFQMSLTPLHSPDGRIQTLLLLQDITELKKAEEQLMQSEKLTALARLSAGVAHEIGNPLTSISSYVQILKGMEFDEFTAEAIDTIYKHIGRIEAIVKNMASFTKTRMEDVRHLSIKELLASTVELVKYDRRTKNISITVEGPDDLPPVRVDGNQLVQVFMNLILNAADAMPDGGQLAVVVGTDEGEVEIAFRDTGQGIDEKDFDRIFDPFYTTKDKGTGLGLSVCQTIVRSFGGDISFESEAGKGSTFRVRLPINEK
jgi:signal transduction histidine kinase